MSSMRFAISALTIVCIASAIGTIVAQNAPPINYVNQFGAFWAEVFSSLDLFRVYNAPWFLLVMFLMLASTSLCVTRNTPKMIKEARAWRMQVRDSAFPAFRQRFALQAVTVDKAAAQVEAIGQWLRQKGYSVREPDGAAAGMPVMVAKKGGAGRLGYIAAHLAIVVISLGGLLDSEVPTKVMAWWWDKTPVELATLTNETVPASSKLPQSTPTYRANLLIPEGERSDLAVINQPNGAFLLDLPFELELKAFRVEYYTTGMPKLFASDVILRDKQTGEVKTTTIEVNKPLIHKGVAIYQSSFDDGGSALQLLAHPIAGLSREPLNIDLKVGQSAPLRGGRDTMDLEVNGFKPINVESLSDGPGRTDAFREHVASVLSPAVNNEKNASLQNVGPSFNYKLRDGAGQAREYHSYMLPFELEGNRVFLTGMRESPDESFRYLRIPADPDDSLTEFLRIRAAMDDASARVAAAAAFARAAAPGNLQEPLAQSALKALDAIAQGGLTNLATIMEQTVPEAEREKAADVVVRMLSGAFWELWQAARQRDGLPRLQATDESQTFAQRALTAYSDAKLLETPLLVTLKDFQEVKASVFQVTRSPGQSTVYLGCLLLVLGIFAMLYVQERRVWIWLKTESDGQAVRVAASSPRQSLEFEREFKSLELDLTSHPTGKAP